MPALKQNVGSIISVFYSPDKHKGGEASFFKARVVSLRPIMAGPQQPPPAHPSSPSCPSTTP